MINGIIKLLKQIIELMRDIIFALFLLVFIKSFGQNFEGSLKYKMNIEISDKMKAMGITKEMLINKMKS
ncbi:MAG TPA: hypothetical protein DDE71_00115 [Tenacibaculum sp.]|nr:hypothetical protein [Tenacibaculum sp.]